MIHYAIESCLKSEYVNRVFVSTEDFEIGTISKVAGAEIVERPEELSEDDVPTQKVVKHFFDNHCDVDIIVLVQANSPCVKTQNIDKAIKLLIEHNLREVRSVSSLGLENGAFWIISREAVDWKGLSVYFGVVTDDAVDIHTSDDLDLAEKQYIANNTT